MCYQGCSGCGSCILGKLKALNVGTCLMCGHTNAVGAKNCEVCGASMKPSMDQLRKMLNAKDNIKST